MEERLYSVSILTEKITLFWERKISLNYETLYREINWKTGMTFPGLGDMTQSVGAKTQRSFFPPRDKALYKPIADKAKAICWGKDGLPPCRVRKDCLREAIINDELHGIFGGMSHRERNAAKRKYKKKGLTLDEWLDQQEK